MYHAIVRRKTRWAFARLNKKDISALADYCAKDFSHHFAGDHSLGGTRTTTRSFKAWFDRLFRLFPKLRFELHDVIVSGWPWNTRVAVTWRDHGQTAIGEDYSNYGVHILGFRWGKLTSLNARLDTQHLAAVLDDMARRGIAEATAPPIEDT